jgi:hypothetical protein
MIMPCVQYGKPVTNLGKQTEAYEFLQEINKKLGSEKLFIEQYQLKEWFLYFKSKYNTYYRIYWDVGNGEYQVMMPFKKLDLQDVECYLLGVLNGLENK